MTIPKLNKLFSLSIFAVLAALVSTSASAETCSNQTLKGAFGYSVTGTIVQNTGPLLAGPFVAVGRIIFDGKGGVTTVRSLNDNGFVLQNDAGTGTYTLNEDCTGSFSITVGPPDNQIQLTLDVVLDDTDELRGVVTNSNVVLVLEGKKQHAPAHRD